MIIKTNVIKGFNRGAKTYDQAACLQAKIARQLAQKLPNDSAQHILEIGCGTGLFSQYLVDYFPKADLYLTDIAPAMLEQCQQRLGQPDNIQWQCLDGEALPLLPTFDLIVSSMTLHWFQQLNTSLQNLKQRLKHNGRLLFAMLTENSLHEWRAMCEQFIVPFATPSFPVLMQLKKQFPEMDWRVEIIEEPYPNLQLFLSTLKSLGAIAPRVGYQPLSSATLRKMMRHFDHPIQMTYEVVYGEYHAQ